MKNDSFGSWLEFDFGDIFNSIFGGSTTDRMKSTKKEKQIFCEGTFIKKDIHGKDCHVGDRLKITRPRIYFKRDVDTGWGYEIVDLKERKLVGTLVLLKTKGLHLKLDEGGYYHLTITDRARNPLKWERL